MVALLITDPPPNGFLILSKKNLNKVTYDMYGPTKKTHQNAMAHADTQWADIATLGLNWHSGPMQ